ncbi:MAG: hypothetical protein H6723_16210 [Sandaracinus sp.]|nr:hypothetical protein [Sandaracinus sp.]
MPRHAPRRATPKVLQTTPNQPRDLGQRTALRKTRHRDPREVVVTPQRAGVLELGQGLVARVDPQELDETREPRRVQLHSPREPKRRLFRTQLGLELRRPRRCELAQTARGELRVVGQRPSPRDGQPAFDRIVRATELRQDLRAPIPGTSPQAFDVLARHLVEAADEQPVEMT